MSTLRAIRSAPSLGLAVIALGVLLRWLAMPQALGDVDSVNHGRALSGFDLERQAPHLPGYPVYTALTRALAGRVSEAHALSLPGILLWAPAGWLLLLGVRRRLGEPVAFGAVAFASLCPGAVVAGAWPASDGLGLAFAAAAAGLLALGDRWARPGLGLLGLMLGVRLSYFPLAISLSGLHLWHTQRRRVRPFAAACDLAALGAGVLAWAVPMAVLTGPARLLELSLGFGHGHMQVWGGTLLSPAAQGVGGRLGVCLFQLWHACLGALWPAPVPGLSALGGAHAVLGVLIAVALVLSLLDLLAAPGRRRAAFLLAALALPYAVWLVGFQNLDKPRHFLPLLPMLGGALSFGHHQQQRAPVALALAALMACVGLFRADYQHQHPVPAVAIARFLQAQHPPAGLVVFAGPEASVLEHNAPGYRIVVPADATVLRAEATRLRALHVDVFLTSGAPGYREFARQGRKLASFGFPASIRPQAERLSLLTYPSGARAAVAPGALTDSTGTTNDPSLTTTVLAHRRLRGPS